MEELVKAAIEVARVTCKVSAEGCDGPWCSAQHKLRAALTLNKVAWQPPTVAEEIQKLETERDAAVAVQDFLKAALLQDQITALKVKGTTS